MHSRPDTADHPARILIVDDDRHNRQVLEILLAAEGFRLVSAASGEEALALVAQEPPDLILLDIMMPGMDGNQVAARLKGSAATKNIPIIMITALNDRDARMRGLTAGAEDFLSKPVDRAELSVRVRNLLRLKAYGDYYDKYSHVLEGEVDSRRAALVESEERMRFALEAAGVGIWDLDYTTGRLRWSETIERQYGLSPGTFGGTVDAFVERVHPEDRQSVRETLARAAESGADFSIQNRAVWPDGSVRSLSGAGRILLGDHGKPTRGVGISQDMTDHRLLERQYQQAQKMEAIGQLASGVAHDFNNLLTVIIGFSELLAMDAYVADHHRKSLDVMLRTARGGSGLTKQLLAFSREQVLNIVALDLNAVINDMVGMLGMLIGHQVEVSRALAPNLPPVLADRGQLEQVVMNLMANARDAMPDGGHVTIETRDVELETTAFHDEGILQGRYVMLAITDTGCGMTADTQRRIFEPFFTTKAVGKGTGLGLATSYGIVKQSQGYIRVDSEIGRGTTFTVYLPIDRGLPASRD